MKKLTIIITVFIGLFVFTSCQSPEKQIVNKTWYVFSVGISQDADNSDANYVYFNKSRGTSTHWFFTEEGGYSIIENGNIVGGKWKMMNKSLIRLSEVVFNPNSSYNVREIEMLKINDNELVLRYKSILNNSPIYTTLYFKSNLDEWPDNSEIDKLNAQNKAL